MTEKQILERKILLSQQAIPQVSELMKEQCRRQIVLCRRKLWEIENEEKL